MPEANLKKSKEQLLELDQKSNSLDQYNVRNNVEIQIMYVNISDERLAEKVIYIFSCLDIDVEGVHIGYLLHDEGPCHVEISSLICSASQLNGFYVIGICHKRGNEKYKLFSLFSVSKLSLSQYYKG